MPVETVPPWSAWPVLLLICFLALLVVLDCSSGLVIDGVSHARFRSRLRGNATGVCII